MKKEIINYYNDLLNKYGMRSVIQDIVYLVSGSPIISDEAIPNFVELWKKAHPDQYSSEIEDIVYDRLSIWLAKPRYCVVSDIYLCFCSWACAFFPTKIKEDITALDCLNYTNAVGTEAIEGYCLLAGIAYYLALRRIGVCEDMTTIIYYCAEKVIDLGVNVDLVHIGNTAASKCSTILDFMSLGRKLLGIERD